MFSEAEVQSLFTVALHKDPNRAWDLTILGAVQIYHPKYSLHKETLDLNRQGRQREDYHHFTGGN